LMAGKNSKPDWREEDGIGACLEVPIFHFFFRQEYRECLHHGGIASPFG
jgi:hypothetical protein